MTVCSPYGFSHLFAGNQDLLTPYRISSGISSHVQSRWLAIEGKLGLIRGMASLNINILVIDHVKVM